MSIQYEKSEVIKLQENIRLHLFFREQIPEIVIAYALWCILCPEQTVTLRGDVCNVIVRGNYHLISFLKWNSSYFSPQIQTIPGHPVRLIQAHPHFSRLVFYVHLPLGTFPKFSLFLGETVEYSFLLGEYGI